MKNPSKIRVLGMVFIIVSALGLFFCVAGIVTTWILHPQIKAQLGGLLDSFNDTLRTTDNGLEVLDSAVQDSKTNLEIIKNSLDDLGITIDNVSTSLEYSATLVGDDLRLTIIDTQTALTSASASAVFIDKTLKFIASIPLIGADYQPDVPLHTSLEQVAGSLEDVPESLEMIEQSLSDTASGLNSLKLNITALGENIDSMEDDLESALLVIEDYQDIMEKVTQKSERLRNHITSYLTIFLLVFSSILFWLGVAQVNVLIQGIDFLQGEQQVVNLADIQRDNTEE